MFNDNALIRKMAGVAEKIMSGGPSSEDVKSPSFVTEAKYEIKNNKVLITKAEWKKVGRDFRGKLPDGTVTMLVNDPKTGGSMLAAVDFVNEGRDCDDLNRMDEGEYSGKLVKTVDTLTGQYGKNRVTAAYEILKGRGAKWSSAKVVTLGSFDSVEDALLALKKVPKEWTSRWYTLGNQRYTDTKAEYVQEGANTEETEDLEEATKGKISGKVAYDWLKKNKVFDDDDFSNPPTFDKAVTDYRGSGPGLDAFINIAKKHGGKVSNDGWGWIGGSREFYDKVLIPAAQNYVTGNALLDEGAEKDTKGDKKAYQAFFQKTLKKYGAKSPGDLADGDKKKFYDEIDAGWKADDEKPEKNEAVKGKPWISDDPGFTLPSSGDAPQYWVRYGKSRRGPISTAKFMTLDKAKKHLRDVQADGYKGFISKNGKPVKESTENEDVDLDEAKEVTPKDVEAHLVKTGVNPKDAKDAVRKGFGYASKMYDKSGVKKIAEIIWTLHEEVDLDEAKGDLPPARKSSDLKGKGKDLEAYAKKHGGIDKADMLAVAKMLQKGDESGALKYASTMDTDPRDYILSIIYSNLDEAAKSLLNTGIKPDSKQWIKARSRVELKVAGAGSFDPYGSRGFGGHPEMVIKKGGSVWIHPFDGDSYVATLDKSNPGSYFVLAKYSVDESKNLKDFANSLEERSKGKKDYEVYHTSYTDALSEVLDLIARNGYTVDPDNWFNKVSTGPRKPSAGKTNSIIVELEKNGKETRRTAAFQVFGMESGRYELNAYIS